MAWREVSLPPSAKSSKINVLMLTHNDRVAATVYQFCGAIGFNSERHRPEMVAVLDLPEDEPIYRLDRDVS